MAVRYPLVIDTTDNNKIKELPLNDSLNLSTNSIVNAVNITASGTLTVANLVVDSSSVSINGNSIATVAVTNSYTDLSNKPSLFDGQYASLTGRPTIVSTTEDLADVSSTQATNGQALIYNSTSGVYEPGSVADAALDLTSQSISELADVAVISIATNQVLKWTGATFANSNVAFSELTGTPTTLSGYGITNAYTKAEVDAQISAPTGDLKGSVFGDDSTVLVDGNNNKVVGDIDTASLRTSESKIALGNQAGETTQGVNSVAIGRLAGYNDQGVNAIAIGDQAGRITQGDYAIAIGNAAGISTQAANSIAINATSATLENQTADSFVLKPIRNIVGTTVMMYDAVSGEVTHSDSLNLINTLVANSITGDVTGSVFGDDSTVLVDGVNNKIVGDIETASLRTSETKIALGSSAGQTTQGIDAVAIGHSSGQSNQRQNSVAIGRDAGKTNQDFRAVAIGYSAGEEDQGGTAVAIGGQAGKTTQGGSAVAVGYLSGWQTQGDTAVAVGRTAGYTSQGEDAIAVGFEAGKTNQGEDAIAIGTLAGYANQAANSIVINATGVTVQNSQASSLVIKPVRSAVGTTMLMYDATTGEVTHTASPVITGDITGSVFGDDSTLLVDGVNNSLHGTLYGNVQGGMQEIVGPGVVNITTTSTEIVTTGTDAYTLANGTYGQIKHIIKIGGSGAATITPASFANGTSVELASNFNSVSLLYTNSGWAVIAAQNITINA